MKQELASLVASLGVESISDPRFAKSMDENDPLKEMRSQYFIPKAADIIRTAEGKYKDSAVSTSFLSAY